MFGREAWEAGAGDGLCDATANGAALIPARKVRRLRGVEGISCLWHSPRTLWNPAAQGNDPGPRNARHIISNWN